jgi:hypothetical protein
LLLESFFNDPTIPPSSQAFGSLDDVVAEAITLWSDHLPCIAEDSLAFIRAVSDGSLIKVVVLLSVARELASSTAVSRAMLKGDEGASESISSSLMAIMLWMMG